MSRKKSSVACAIVELRSGFDENQQKFSDRLGVALATLARWEIDNRQPSPRYLKELWHLAAERDRADLAKVFADAFATAAGYALSGEAGFHVRRLISDIRTDAAQLLLDDPTPENRKRIGRILDATWKLTDALRVMDIEPPFRAFTHVKGKPKK
jgi:transcriptional regulator with XRE-family HTH domain